ncbi:hypothetical protein M9H77_34728 [Catharanthus roseus]|uniref:Uncharacterized protein n=1 Tax=Catharanthus roseus TaxID=4058 RepID=A0ACB9ZM95_CATRO|nr:hypothetical protein M9H77_34728 [Catharanthus roseus]
MDELFGQIDYRSKSDAIVMRLLRSAMDKAHENVQSMNGPMEFLHERSKFYELAAILVEGGLNIVQEEADIQEPSREKILTDLMEIKDWLQRRNAEMRLLITEKDKELLERMENELKLRQTLELNERELVHLREKEEQLQRSKSEGFQEFHRTGDVHVLHKGGAGGGDIRALKNSVDQQFWNIKQKLEDEKNSIKHKMRKTISNVSDSELYSKLSALAVEDDHLTRDDHFSGVKSLCSTLNPGKYNIMIRQMSSDIDILKGTFDIAFGRMENVALIPLEKRWKMIIERDTILVSIKGFIRDVQKIFDAEFNKERNHHIPNGFCREKWSGLIDNMKELAEELKDLCSRNKAQSCSSPSSDMRRTVSEPLPFVPFKQEEVQETNGNGSHFVAKMIMNHESIIQKHRIEWSWLTKEMLRGKDSSSVKIDKENDDEVESRIQNAIRKLHDIIEWNDNLGDEKGDLDHTDEISQLVEERDCLNLQILLIEEIYLLLIDGFMRNQKDLIDDHSQLNTKAGELEEKMLLQRLDYTLREDVHAIYMQETNKEWNQYAEFDARGFLLQEEIYKLALHESLKDMKRQVEVKDSETFLDAIESLIREDVYIVYLREVSKTWKTKRDEYDIEMSIRKDIIQFFLVEMMKEANAITIKRESEILDRINISNKNCMIESVGSILENCEEGDGYLSTQTDIFSPYEDTDKDKTKHWLLTDGEKLETVLQEVKASKALLLMLDYNSTRLIDAVAVESERHNTYCLEETEMLQQLDQSVLSPIIGFQQALVDFKHMIHSNLESKSFRIEKLKQQIEELVEPVALIRERKLLYKKAFITRSQNLLLAENEVDLLGNQVEKLMSLLQRIYLILNQNSIALSSYFGVFDVLNLIKREFNEGVA